MSDSTPAPLPLPPVDRFAHEQDGYKAGLKARQLQMIAIGGAIGTGLFLGAGGRLNAAGPSLFLVFLICGVFAYLILRALGELVLHRPSSGSLVSYAREFYGEKFAFVAGWLYFQNWAFTAIADVTAIALYVHYWSAFSSVPQWLAALIALLVVLAVNLVSVKVFGEMEFWFALIKVVALVAFLVVGFVFLIFAFPLNPEIDGVRQAVTPGFTLWLDNGGLFPNGLLATAVIIQGVVFAYAAIELVGTAAGETENPRKVVPKAINTVIFRIAIFYVGAVLLLALLLPYTAYEANQSPFVTFFASIGDGSIGLIAGSVMNFVVLTAALSSLNAGLYSTGRILRSMSLSGSAPRFTQKMSKSGVPYGGILLTAALTLIGIVLNLVVPEDAFNIVLNGSAIGIVASWGTIVLCQMKFRQHVAEGKAEPPTFKLPGAPYTSWVTLGFLAIVLVLIALDWPAGTWTMIVFVVVIIPLLIIGWFACRKQILEIAAARDGHTGAAPIVAVTPGMVAALENNEAAEGEAPVSGRAETLREESTLRSEDDVSAGPDSPPSHP